MPLDHETVMTPIASAELEIRPMAASPLILLDSFMRSSRKAASTTTGIVKASGAKPSAAAIAREPNPTWERPSPIME